jgi:hypothetical protein
LAFLGSAHETVKAVQEHARLFRTVQRRGADLPKALEELSGLP